MGSLLEILGGSTESKPTAERVDDVYFVSREASDRPVVDYPMTLGPMGDRELGFYRVTEPVQIPDGAALEIEESGDVVSLGGSYRAHVAELVGSEAAGEESVSLPDRICGTEVSPRCPRSRADLRRLTLSLR